MRFLGLLKADEHSEAGAPPTPELLERMGVFMQEVAAAGVLAFLAGLSIEVVPSGMAGVRVSQLSGTLPGTLYPGTHFVLPMVQSLALYPTRDNDPEPDTALVAIT